jgi:AraC-like DNA-binding protein
MGAYEVVDYLVLSSDTVLAGMHQLARYFRLISDTLRLQIIDEAGATRLVVSASDGAPAPRFAVEYLIAITLLNLARATDAWFKPSQVSFMHRIDDPPSFERHLACKVASEQPWNGFSASHDAWSLAMPKRDPTLRRVLEHHAQSLSAHLPEALGIAADVRREIAALLPTGEVRIAHVARKLGRSPRTLQRQLAEHGCVFQDMVEEVLRALAERYLRDTKLSIGEVAYLLGYSEPSAFHRAFRRWFATTPDAFRKSARR